MSIFQENSYFFLDFSILIIGELPKTIFIEKEVIDLNKLTEYENLSKRKELIVLQIC
jgi:hypothetical protein